MARKKTPDVEPDSSAQPPRPARKDREAKLAQLEAQIKGMKRELAQAERKRQAQREAILGRVVWKAAQTDSALATQISTLVEKAVTKPAERAVLGLSPENTSPDPF